MLPPMRWRKMYVLVMPCPIGLFVVSGGVGQTYLLHTRCARNINTEYNALSIAADAPKLWLAVQVPSDVNGWLLECWFDMVAVPWAVGAACLPASAAGFAFVRPAYPIHLFSRASLRCKICSRISQFCITPKNNWEFLFWWVRRLFARVRRSSAAGKQPSQRTLLALRLPVPYPTLALLLH